MASLLGFLTQKSRTPDKSEAFIPSRMELVGHILLEIFRYVYFFIKNGNGKVFGTLNRSNTKCHHFLLVDWKFLFH